MTVHATETARRGDPAAMIRDRKPDGSDAMSSTTDKIKGLANEAAGNVKQGIGKATGNEKLQAEGKAQELKGETQRAVGGVKDGVNNAAQKAADAVKGR
ncbi:hypothetical protein GCM10007886_04930 [Methylobacterium gregans]|nr:hypothetical protein GCM10007886_04930 [Methylobacterium gregans]